MSCKPTAGEVREFPIGSRVYVADVYPDGEWRSFGGIYHHPKCGCGPSRIVEVAPKNRARVTAGPAWMGAR